MGMGGQQQALVALHPGKTWYPLYRTLGGPNWMGAENVAPTWVWSLYHPAVLTELSWPTYSLFIDQMSALLAITELYSCYCTHQCARTVSHLQHKSSTDECTQQQIGTTVQGRWQHHTVQYIAVPNVLINNLHSCRTTDTLFELSCNWYW